ncbi:MAG: hypothetical protein ACREJO_13030 [Phycisphaerales bacterium]
MNAAPTPAPDPVLHNFLAGRDVACPGCGYNLRGVPAAACPECGRGLKLDLAGRHLPNSSLRLSRAAVLLFLGVMLWRAGLFGYIFYREGAARAFTKGAYYLICFALALVAGWGLWRLTRSFGREDPSADRSTLDLAAILLALLMFVELARELGPWLLS